MLFVDHETKLVYPSFQETKTGEESCQSKCDYETFAKRYKVDIETHQADNRAFHMSIFQKEIADKGQELSLSRVNLQCKNGLVEHPHCTL
jgi:hypothetical protein